MKHDFFYVGGGASKTPEEVAQLQKKYDLFDKEIIQTIFKDVLNITVKNITKPSIVGLPHVTYFVEGSDGKEYCFRANLGNEKPEIELVIEKLASDLARKNDIKSNNIIHVDCSRKKYSFDFQIQEKLSGENPEHNFRGTQKDYDKISFELGQIIAKLSLIQFDGFGRFDKNIALTENHLVTTMKSNYEYIALELDTQVKYILDAELINSKQAEAIINTFSSSRELLDIKQGSMVHYDLADHNLFYDPVTFGVVGIFDWEAVCVSDPMLDLASAPTWKTLYERESLLIEGFKSIAKLPDNYKEKMDLYRLRTVIWKVVHNIKFDILNKERSDRFYNALVPFKI